MRILVTDRTVEFAIQMLTLRCSFRERWYNVEDKSEGWLDRIPGNNLEHVMHIPVGFRCVFSYDVIPAKKLVLRHLSVGVDGGMFPAPEVIQTLVPMFGFTGKPVPPPQYFPDNWYVKKNDGGQIDSRCIEIFEITGIDPDQA